MTVEKTDQDKSLKTHASISETNIGALPDSSGDVPETESKDCRDHCMHCGMHCIYLNKDKQGG